MTMGDQATLPKHCGNAVTTGQGQYDWTNKGSRRDTYRHKFRTLPSTPSLQPSGTAFSLPDHGQTIQSGEFRQCGAVDSTRNGSDSMESMQQHIAALEPVISDPDSMTLTESEDCSEDDDDDKAGLLTSRSSRFGTSLRIAFEKGVKVRKKVGRPIAYRGDPNAPELTEQERRRIKRRIANRESARRVRHKRQGLLDDLQIKVDNLQSQNKELRVQAAESKIEKEELSVQLRDMTQKYKQTIETNASMQLELESLRSSLQLRMTALEDALDRQENGTDGQEDKTLFGSTHAQAALGYNAQPTYPFNEQGDFKGSYSFQLALDAFPSFHLGERSVDLLPTEVQDLAILKNEHLGRSNPNSASN